MNEVIRIDDPHWDSGVGSRVSGEHRNARKALDAYMKEHPDVKKAHIARAVLGEGAATRFSQWTNGLYKASPAVLREIDRKVLDWLDIERSREISMPVLQPVRTAAFFTIMSSLQICRETQGIEVLSGASGIGKTFTVEEFRKTNSDVMIFYARPTWSKKTAFLAGQIQTLTGKVERSCRSWVLEAELTSILARYAQNTMLIFNDAHNLEYEAIDILACLNEEQGYPVVLTGHPILSDKISAIQRYNSQLYDRIRTRCFQPYLSPKLTLPNVRAFVHQIIPKADETMIQFFNDSAIFPVARDIVLCCRRVQAQANQVGRKVSMQMIKRAAAEHQGRLGGQ